MSVDVGMAQPLGWRISRVSGADRKNARAAAAAGAAVRLLRGHWLFACLFVAGAGMRVITQLAYQPALIFYDSAGYLLNTRDLVPQVIRPLGYPLLLRPVLELHDLSWVPVVQHLMGLAAALLLYATLLRIRVRRWLAALAAAALLLDGYQLGIEQWVLSDTLFELLLVAGYAIMLWQRPPGPLASATAGAVLGVAVWVRLAGVGMVAPAAIYLLLAQVGWRRRLGGAALVVVGFAAPVLGYMGWFDSAQGRFALSNSSARFLYARVATFADCSRFHVPADERALCPSSPPDQRLPTNCYEWCAFSPYATYKPPPGEDKDAVAGRFTRRVLLHQPEEYARLVVSDFLYGFGWTRHNRQDAIGARYWRFTVDYPFQYANHGEPEQMVRSFGGGTPRVHTSLTRFLRDYQQICSVRGPFLATGLILGLVAVAGVGRARRSQLRAATLFLVLGGVCVTLLAYLVTLFSWRYQLPLLIFYPAAGAAGVCALLGGSDGSQVAATDSTVG